MGVDLNIFRLLGDLSHTASKLTLITAIHRNHSAEGVSLLTQMLYFLVFITRYLDLFWTSPLFSMWNFVLKIFYISSSVYVVWIMMRWFPRTREKEKAWKITTGSLGGSLVGAPVVTLVFRGWSGTSMGEILWCFSIILESVCVLPQLLLLRQTSVPTVLDSYYLVTLGSYRFFYILNWILHAATHKYVDPISTIFGIIQTLLYVDFAWVYYSRQRVKLRGGGVVDSDDLGKSFLVRRFIGNNKKRSAAQEEEDIADEDEALAGQENGTIRPSGGQGWGARGISVSADDTLEEHQARGPQELSNPDAFEDEEEEADAPPPPAKDARSVAHEEADDSAKQWARASGD